MWPLVHIRIHCRRGELNYCDRDGRDLGLAVQELKGACTGVGGMPAVFFSDLSSGPAGWHQAFVGSELGRY